MSDERGILRDNYGRITYVRRSTRVLYRIIEHDYGTGMLTLTPLDDSPNVVCTVEEHARDFMEHTIDVPAETTALTKTR